MFTWKYSLISKFPSHVPLEVELEDSGWFGHQNFWQLAYEYRIELHNSVPPGESFKAGNFSGVQHFETALEQVARVVREILRVQPGMYDALSYSCGFLNAHPKAWRIAERPRSLPSSPRELLVYNHQLEVNVRRKEKPLLKLCGENATF